MYHICIFAGTTEGRKLAEFLSRQIVRATVCVATEYGGERIPPSDSMTVSARRLPPEEIAQLLNEESFDLVIDATHPYAQSITRNLAAACASAEVPYLRLLREESCAGEDAVFVSDVTEAVEFLNRTEGTILLTTGSKELSQYASLERFSERVYARVLPMEASIQSCLAAGLKPDHILAMQGPFTEELNLAMLHFLSARWMVTKDGGIAGGFEQKVSAARKAGVRLVVIGRPMQESGCSYGQVIQILCRSYGCVRLPEITIAGIGPGNMQTMTRESLQAIEQAECLIGAGRMLETFAGKGQGRKEAIAPDQITAYILEHTEYQSFAVLMSGDTGFFSGTKKLLASLQDHGLGHVRVLPGISSLSYFCSRLQRSYEDLPVVSLHGREHDIAADVKLHGSVFALVGGDDGICRLCHSLEAAGLGEARIRVGERLSYPDEKITTGTARELANGTFAPLSVAMIDWRKPADETIIAHMEATDEPIATHMEVPDKQIVNHVDMTAEQIATHMEISDKPIINHVDMIEESIITHGLPDEWFQRGMGQEGPVPMTKREVRSICLSMLQLTEHSICWDIGAGTGSVAIEMARMARKGQVYAIERKEEALDLLRSNQKQFGVANMTVIHGSAPQACMDLPAPSHVFIGGSSGNIRPILELLVECNPCVRIVATAITLESVSELTACLRELSFSFHEIVQVQVARDRKAGPYHLMTGQNPICIFTMQKEGQCR